MARRRVPLAEFDIATNPDVQRTLTVLTAARLLTADRGTVEVAHEALFREWPRLAGWLDEDQQSRRVRAHLTDAARGWDESGRSPGELYRGARLAAVLDWSAAHAAEVNDLERQFVAESEAAGQAEERRQRRANRRLRLLLLGASVGLVLAIAASVVALGQRAAAEESNAIADQQRAAADQERAAADAQTVIAEHAADTADAQRLGAQALGAKDLDVALLLARQGEAIDDTVATRANLLAALERSPAAIRISRPLAGRPQSIVGSADGSTVLVTNNGGQAAVIDAATDATRYIYALPGDTWAMSLADNGEVIVLSAGPKLTFLDPLSDQVVGSISYPAGGLGLSWTPDLKTIGRTSADERSITIYDSATDRVLRTLRFPAGLYLTDVLMFDGGTVLAPMIDVPIPATGPSPRDEPGAMRFAVWGPGDTTPRSMPEVSTSAPRGAMWQGSALSPDHRTLLLPNAPRDGEGTLLDLVHGTELTLKGEHSAPIMGGAFSPERFARRDERRRRGDAPLERHERIAGGDPRGPRRQGVGPDILRCRRSPDLAHLEPRRHDDDLGSVGIATSRRAVPCRSGHGWPSTRRRQASCRGQPGWAPAGHERHRRDLDP